MPHLNDEERHSNVAAFKRQKAPKRPSKRRGGPSLATQWRKVKSITDDPDLTREIEGRLIEQRYQQGN